MRLSLILFVLFSISAAAQDRLVSLNYDNDYFSATDRYYTQGVRLEYIAPVLLKLPVNVLLFKPETTTQTYAGIAIERDGFTPTSIRIDTVPVGNRPYAGTMFLSNFRTALNHNTHTKIYSQFDIGLMGPAVGGKQEQTNIHRAIGDILPLGWEYQVSNDVIVNYTLQYEKGLVNKEHIVLAGLSQVRLGTLYTDVSVGAMLRFGLMNDYFKSLGITKQSDSRKFQAYLYVKTMGKAVGYNATMQGGLFSESIYTLEVSQVNRFVGQVFYGVTIAFKRFQVVYGKANISQEYKGGLAHGWGHCNLSYCF